MEYYSAIKNNAIFSNMDGPRDYYYTLLIIIIIIIIDYYYLVK